MKSILQFVLRQGLFINLVTAFIIVVGLFSTLNLRKNAFPEVDFDIALVNTLWPGASSQDVEKLITKPIEDAIEEVDDIKEFTSTSSENFSSISIIIEPDTDDTDKVFNEIRNAIDRIKDLPQEADDPLVEEISTSRLEVIEWYIFVNPKNKTPISYGELRDVAENLENILKTVPGVGSVNKKGWRDKEILIELNPNLLKRYYIGSNQIIDALRARNINLPGGSLEFANKEEIVVRTTAEFDTIEEILNVPVRSNEVGAAVYIKDIATVKESYAEDEYIETAEGVNSIALSVVKTTNSDLMKIVHDTRKEIKNFKKKWKGQIEIQEVNDVSYYVSRRLQVLVSNAVIGFILIIILLLTFMDWRSACMVLLGIPVALSIGMIVVYNVQGDINLLSMFGLIMAIGIIVDDAIVVSDRFYYYLEKGLKPKDAALKGTLEMFLPITAAVCTTIFVFSPLLFMTGIFGKFIFSIPFVVIICICASYLESFLILPPHLHEMNSWFPAKKMAPKRWFVYFQEKMFKRLLAHVLSHKKSAALVLLAFVFLSIAIQIFAGKGFKLFPGTVDNFYITFEGKPNFSKEKMQKFLNIVGKEMQNSLPKSELQTFVGRVGIQQQGSLDGAATRGTQYGMILVYLISELDRNYSYDALAAIVQKRTSWLAKEEKQKEIKDYLKDLEKTNPVVRKQMQELEKQSQALSISPQEKKELAGQLKNLTFEKLEGGPPQGKAVTLRILGSDIDELKKIGLEYKSVLKNIPGVVNINDNILKGKQEIHIKIKDDIASIAGIAASDIAKAINTVFEGTIATSVRRFDEEVDIRVRFADPFRNDLDSFNNIFISNRQGNLIPVSKVIVKEKNAGTTSILHYNGDRLILITSDINRRIAKLPNVIKKIKKEAKRIQKKYPKHQLQFGGEEEDTQESMQSLQQAFFIALFLCFMILVLMYRSLIQPFIVLTPIPFAVLGSMIAFALHGDPLSFLGILGLIGLSGIVINTSIVMIDRGNTIRKEHPEMTNAQVALEAGTSRLRAIILTSVTTIGGLLPTAYGLGGYDPFLVPMAMSFGWGLIFGTAFVLFYVPILYNKALDWSDYFQSRLNK